MKLQVNCSKFSLSGYVGVSADVSERGSGGGGYVNCVFVTVEQVYTKCTYRSTIESFFTLYCTKISHL
jgi:hypothetical protein